MSDEIHASIRASASKIRQMIDQVALDGDTEHSDLYLNIRDDEVHILQSSPGEIVLSYGSFGEDYFADITLEKEMDSHEVQSAGCKQYNYSTGAEAIIEVERTKQYLDYAGSSGTIELTFSGTDKRRLSTMLRAEGALETWVNLPGAETDIDSAPQWLPFRYNDDDEYTNEQGDPIPTIIKTDTSELETIVDVVDTNNAAGNYPLVVEDGELKINVGRDNRDGVRGVLGSREISGPDVENKYFDGFEEILSVLNGRVELQTAPGNGPLSFVYDAGEGATVRHINGAVEG